MLSFTRRAGLRRISLRLRFLFLLGFLLIIVFLAITLVIVRQNSKTLKADLINQSKSFADLATQPIGQSFVTYQYSGTIDIQQQIQNFTDLDADINQVEVVNTSGKVLFVNNTGTPVIHITSNEATALNATYLYNKKGDLRAIVKPYVENFGIHEYAVVYGISYQRVNSSIHSIIASFAALSALIVIASVIIWYILINRLFLRPVAELSRLSLIISKGNLNQQIRLGRNDEIGDLAGAVNAMANSLKADIAKLTEVDQLKSEFMMITSHNLRTPLTIIQGYLDIVKDMELPEGLKEPLDNIDSNARRLTGFAEDVLTISTIEAGENTLHAEVKPIDPLLEDIAKEFNTLAIQKELHFIVNIDTKAKVSVSKPHLHSAMWNLLDNAYKFTHKGGSVQLTARRQLDHVEIIVEDDGIGIRKEEIPRLFTKFHRGTDTFQYDYEGTGIGLYITKLIVEQHGGHIYVQSIEGKGSTFTISLPIAAESPQPTPQIPPAGTTPSKETPPEHNTIISPPKEPT